MKVQKRFEIVLTGIEYTYIIYNWIMKEIEYMLDFNIGRLVKDREGLYKALQSYIKEKKVMDVYGKELPVGYSYTTEKEKILPEQHDPESRQYYNYMLQDLENRKHPKSFFYDINSQQVTNDQFVDVFPRPIIISELVEENRKGIKSLINDIDNECSIITDQLHLLQSQDLSRSIR